WSASSACCEKGAPGSVRWNARARAHASWAPRRRRSTGAKTLRPPDRRIRDHVSGDAPPLRGATSCGRSSVSKGAAFWHLLGTRRLHLELDPDAVADQEAARLERDV